jgi:CheY-like chemotaxis protein
MRLEFEPNSSALPFVENEAVDQSAASEVERMLREGVRAAQEGKRAEARTLLLRVTEADADSENAWLWLASISEYPEELLVFLNNVLRVNSQNERALEWHKATKSLLAKTLVQRGVEAAGENRKDFARQCFEQALEHESENEMAWLWMASIADSEDEQTACFERVLSLNPENETAQASLKAIQTQKTNTLFQEALCAAFDGRHIDAQGVLEHVLSRDGELEDAWVLKSHLAGSFEERAECFLKLRALNPENEMAKANLASWRMLADKLVEQPQAEAVTEFTTEAEFIAAVIAREEALFEEAREEVSNETFSADAAALSTDELVNESEAEQTAEFSVADEAEKQTAEFSEPELSQPETTYFDESDAPTQDLRFDPSDATAEEAARIEEPEENQLAAAPETENAYEEFRADEIRFESEENQDAAPEFETPENLRAELEAEEAEMNWAFTVSRENKEAEDYFRDLDETEDIHKTQQANYDAEDFAADFAGEEQGSAEASAETSAETVAEMPGEEWRDTSPSVFVNYSPVTASENSFDAPTVAFSFTETAVAEEAPAKAETGASQMAFEDDRSPAEEESLTEETVQDEVSMSTEEPARPSMEEQSAPPKAETVLCPFCDAVNEKQAFSCGMCQTVLTLSDLEMLLGRQPANQEKLQQSVESLERENESYGLNVEQLTNLGVGHVNLKNYRQGFFYLQEAVRMNPSNVLLDAQVNALAIRLSEIEEQQSVHDLMAKNRKILVVDDSPTVRKLISGKLEKCGHEVVCAIDGVDALEKINELKPDLVLLDITMPRMDGYQVCKLIRNNETTKDVPVIMISGKDGFFDKVRGRMAGTSGYITKPFGPETLMKTVETYLN